MSIANSVNKSDDSDFKTYFKHSMSYTIVLDPTQPVEIFNAINFLIHVKRVVTIISLLIFKDWVAKY